MTKTQPKVAPSLGNYMCLTRPRSSHYLGSTPLVAVWMRTRTRGRMEMVIQAWTFEASVGSFRPATNLGPITCEGFHEKEVSE